MKHYRTFLLGSLLLVAWIPALAGLAAEGILDEAEVTFCSTFYFVNNPCTGEISMVNAYPYDLDHFLCDYVSVTGPDVGLECVEIGIESFVSSSPPCPVQIANLRLLFNSAGALTLRWSPFACIERYDVVRGELAQLAPGDLGAVSCVGENVSSPQKSLPGDPNPDPGQANFYLVRATGGELGWTHYGHTSQGVQRFPQSGDCTP